MTVDELERQHRQADRDDDQRRARQDEHEQAQGVWVGRRFEAAPHHHGSCRPGSVVRKAPPAETWRVDWLAGGVWGSR